MRGLRKIADEYGMMLIADEIQSGFGRTGKWFAVEHFQIEPDILIIAKGLASGMPISGVIAPLEYMQRWTPGSHGGTYGGNAVAAAAAVATIETIREENLLENAQARGVQLTADLKQLQARFKRIAEVRGLGLMIGVEFRDENGAPDKASAKAVSGACLERGLMLLTCGPWDNTIRWIPPLIVSEAQIARGLSIFADALENVLGKSS
jgi:4-aminobutyrate aminotransferase